MRSYSRYKIWILYVLSAALSNIILNGSNSGHLEGASNRPYDRDFLSRHERKARLNLNRVASQAPAMLSNASPT